MCVWWDVLLLSTSPWAHLSCLKLSFVFLGGTSLPYTPPHSELAIEFDLGLSSDGTEPRSLTKSLITPAEVIKNGLTRPASCTDGCKILLPFASFATLNLRASGPHVGMC